MRQILDVDVLYGYFYHFVVSSEELGGAPRYP